MENAQTTLNLMIDADPRRSHRQLAIIGQEGNASIHTGKNCLDWAGHKSGPGYAVQGNLLAGPEVIQAMAEAFEDSKGTLAEKMITALREAQKMGAIDEADKRLPCF